MPYDQRNLMGLDALSPTIAAYKQFVERQNNVGDPNVVQFLASRGEPQLAGLIAKKMRVENAAKAQQALAQQPQSAPPTVADQYKMAEQQQAQQAMAAQMAQMQQARMAQAAPGLAGMPNPIMNRASFAGGGIVAFADGGDVQHYAIGGLTAGEEREYNTLMANYNREKAGYDLGQDWDRNRLKELQNKIEYANNVGSVQRRVAAGDPRAAMELQRLQASAPMATSPAGSAAAPSPKFSDESAPARNPPATTQGVGLASIKKPGDFSTDMGFTQPPAATSDTTSGAAPPAAPPAAAPSTGTRTSSRSATPAPVAAPEEDPYQKLMGEKPDLKKMQAEQLASEQAGKYGRFSQALNDEDAWIKQHQEDYGVSKKEAQKNFFINLGASLLGNRSPFFTTALGEAISQNYGQMTQDLRKLKADQDNLEAKRIDLAYKREQALQNADEKTTSMYNTALEKYNALAVKSQEHKDDVAAKLSEVAERKQYYAYMQGQAGGVEGQVFRSLLGGTNPDTGKNYTPAEAYQLMQSGKASVLAAGARSATSRLNTLISQKNKLETALNTTFMKEDRDRLNQAITQLDFQIAQERGQGGAGAGSATLPPAAGGAPTSGVTSGGTKYQIEY